MGNMHTFGDFAGTLPGELDRRRHLRAEMREAIAKRSRNLEGRDREIMLSIYHDGRSAASIARISGENHRAMVRHVRKITSRVLNPLFPFVIQHRETWSRRRQRIAKLIYIQGLSIRETADLMKISIYLVRKHRNAIEEMYESHLPKHPRRRSA